MQSHIKLAAIMHILFGVFALLTGLIVIIAFGGVGIFVGFAAENDPGAAVAVPIILFIASIVAFFVFLSSIPAIAAGIGLLNYHNWARILAIILSILYIPFHFPLGTILGVYTLWVLFSPETSDLFNRRNNQETPTAPPPLQQP